MVNYTVSPLQREEPVIVLTFVVTAHWNLARVERSAMARVAVWVAGGMAVGVIDLGATKLIMRAADVRATGPETAMFYVDLDEMSTRVGKVLVPEVYMREPLTSMRSRSRATTRLIT
jgi:hypothetical protein